jgi:hypothetical protein
MRTSNGNGYIEIQSVRRVIIYGPASSSYNESRARQNINVRGIEAIYIGWE